MSVRTLSSKPHTTSNLPTDRYSFPTQESTEKIRSFRVWLPVVTVGTISLSSTKDSLIYSYTLSFEPVLYPTDLSLEFLVQCSLTTFYHCRITQSPQHHFHYLDGVVHQVSWVGHIQLCSPCSVGTGRDCPDRHRLPLVENQNYQTERPLQEPKRQSHRKYSFDSDTP